MNKSSMALSLLTVGLALFTNQAAAVPPVDGMGKPATFNCKPAVTTTATGATIPNLVQPVLHFDKIIFAIVGQPGQFPLKAIPGTVPGVNTQALLEKMPLNTELDIKVLDDPRTVADLKGKVLTFLGAFAGPEYYPAIRIIDVEYATVICPK